MYLTQKGKICVTFFSSLFHEYALKGYSLTHILLLYVLYVCQWFIKILTIIKYWHHSIFSCHSTEFLSLHHFKEKASVKQNHEFTHMRKHVGGHMMHVCVVTEAWNCAVHVTCSVIWVLIRFFQHQFHVRQ